MGHGRRRREFVSKLKAGLENSPFASLALMAHSAGSRLMAANATTRRIALGVAILGSRLPATQVPSAHLIATVRSRLTDRHQIEAFQHLIASRLPKDGQCRLRSAQVLSRYRFYDDAQSLISDRDADPAIDALKAICAIHSGKLAAARALLASHTGNKDVAMLIRARVELARMEEDWDWLSEHYRSRICSRDVTGSSGGRDAIQLAEVEMARGNLDEARSLLFQVLESDATALDVRLQLIRISLQSMKTEEIRAAIPQLQTKEALASPKALALLGDCHAFFNEHDAAADAYEASLRQSFPSGFVASVYRRLLVSEAAGKDRSARRSQALRNYFHAYPLKSARAWVIIGRAHLEANDLDGHLACCREALKRDPGSTNALQWYAHGLAWSDGLSEPGQSDVWEEVRRLYEKAIFGSASHPSWMVTDYLRLCARVGDLETASAWLERFRGIFEMPAMRGRSHSSRMLVHQGSGNYLEAHRAYADDGKVTVARRHVPNFTTSIEQLPAEAKVLFLSEGGVGDEIRFSQLYDELIHRFPKSVFTVEDRLMPLLLRSFPAERLHPVRRYFRRSVNCNEIGFIGELPSSELSHYFDNSVWPMLQDFDAVVPVKPIMAELRPDREAFLDARIRPLEVDAARRQDFTERLRALGPGPYIGISWASSVSLYRRSSHYFALDEVIDTIERSQATFVNLNYYDDAEDMRRIEDAVGVGRIISFTDFDKWDDFDTTAALMGALDLVIGVNNAVLELAGAVDAPACFCAFAPENAWRRMGQDGRDAYYKSVRVFTPTGSGGRESVLDQVSDAISRCAGVEKG